VDSAVEAMVAMKGFAAVDVLDIGFVELDQSRLADASQGEEDRRD